MTLLSSPKSLHVPHNQSIRVTLIMTTAVIKSPDRVVTWEECLDDINTILELKCHVVVCPVSFLSFAIPMQILFQDSAAKRIGQKN
jgi:hypothetical protein